MSHLGLLILSRGFDAAVARTRKMTLRSRFLKERGRIGDSCVR